MRNYVVILLFTIIFKPNQYFKVTNRLMYAKMAFRTNCQQVVYVKFQATKEFPTKYVMNVQTCSRAT